MSWYSIALFFHVTSDIALITGMGIWLVAYGALRRAERVEQVRTLTGLMLFSEAFYIVSGLLLLGSGVYMTLTVWGFDTAWIDVALATLALVLPVGPLIAKPRIEALTRAANEAPDGLLPPDLAAQIHHPLLGMSLYIMMAGVIGIVFLMTVKPALLEAILAILAAVMLGVIFSLPLWRAARIRSSRSTG